jgi:hypothetical protein
MSPLALTYTEGRWPNKLNDVNVFLRMWKRIGCNVKTASVIIRARRPRGTNDCSASATHGRMREILSAGPANIRGECHCGECPNDYLAQLQIEIAEAVLSQRAQIVMTYIDVICDGCPFWKSFF